MSIHLVELEQTLEAPRQEAFELFSDPFNLERITPPWLRFRLLAGERFAISAGTLIEYRLILHGVPLRWVTEIAAWEPGRRFIDVQRTGPYRLWHHIHEFVADGDRTLMRDTIRYMLPLGPLGEVAHRAFVRRDLEQIFEFRSSAISGLLAPASAQPLAPAAAQVLASAAAQPLATPSAQPQPDASPRAQRHESAHFTKQSISR